MRYLPLLAFLLLCVVLGFGLIEKKAPDTFVSKMLGQKVESFPLALLDAKKTLAMPEAGKVTVLNIFASWCESCQAEHAALTAFAGKLPVIGLAWKDKPEKIKIWLAKNGNPYTAVLLDEKGQSTLPLGLSGVPETFVFDKKGVVRYNKKAAVDAEEIENVIMPLVERLQDE